MLGYDMDNLIIKLSKFKKKISSTSALYINISVNTMYRYKYLIIFSVLGPQFSWLRIIPRVGNKCARNG